VGVLIAVNALAQTTVPGGNVSGIWLATGSPYLIEGEINIPNEQQLTIDPGVDVIFQGHYMFIIRGALSAEGTEIDSIRFTAADTSEGWWGFRLYGSDAFSLFYSTVEYARAFGPSGPEHIGGGLYCDTSSPVISHCRFTNNRATTGGGMGFMWYSNPTITNCLVDSNWAQWGGGIFADEYSRVRVLNCTVTGNTGVVIGGGIRGFLYCGYTIINTLVEGNFGAGGVNLTGTIDDTIMYCDFYNNEGGDLVGSVPPDAGIIVTTNNNGDSCDIYYNIFENPQYYSTIGDSAYFLTSNSPCIDAGDPAFALDPDSTIADIGAFYYHQTETIVPGGNVSGTWTALESPYLIDGEITIAEDDTLIIEPGVDVIFQGHYKLIVNGWLFAEGTETDSILFTAADTSEGWDDIRFVDAPDSSILKFCTLQYSSNHSASIYEVGGGVSCCNSNIAMTNCTLRNNTSSLGGAIGSITSGLYIEGCVIVDNSSYGSYSSAGGGISIHASNLVIERTLIHGNTTWWHGGWICADFSTVTITGCTITENDGGTEAGGYYAYDSNSTLLNNIIWANLGDQIVVNIGSSLITYCNVQGSWPGTGNIDEDPLFVDPANGDYHLQSVFGSYHGGAWLPDLNHSPCIDAGDPVSPFSLEPEPNGGIVNMGVYGNTEQASKSNANYPDMVIELTYVSGSPVGIGGGNLYFELFLENQDTIALDFDAWLEISYEGGIPFTAVMRSFNNYLPGWSINRPDMWYPIDPGYPAGNYTFTGKVGEHPDIAWDASGFPFVKEGTDHAAGFIPYHPDVEFPNPFDEISKGEGLAGRGDLAPTEFALYGAYPNPFNPTTTIRFDLPVAAQVRLDVFDINGRNVGARRASPSGRHKTDPYADVWLTAGVHEVSFDGSGLASGIYFYRIEAGEFSSCRKMVLLK